jgi:hypothetical protein
MQQQDVGWQAVLRGAVGCGLQSTKGFAANSSL